MAVGDKVNYSTLSSWISSLNTIRTRFGQSTYSDSTGAAQNGLIKATTINNYLTSLNSLRSTTYGQWGTYYISNPESVSTGTLIQDSLKTKIDSTISNLNSLFANTLTNLTTTSGFSLVGVSSYFSLGASFTRTFSPGSGCSNNTNFGKNSNYSPDVCTHNVNFNKSVSFFRNTTNSTDNPYNSKVTATSNSILYNTPNSLCFNYTDCSNNTDYRSDSCVNNTNFSQNTNNTNNTNFSPDTACSNTCSNTGTENSLALRYSGFSVK